MCISTASVSTKYIPKCLKLKAEAEKYHFKQKIVNTFKYFAMYEIFSYKLMLKSKYVPS